MTQLIPFVIVLVLLWLLLIQPQRRRQSAQRALQAGLERGDVVLTVGGLYGTIRVLGDDDATLEVAPGTNVRVDRRAIAQVVERAEPPAEPEQTPETPS